LMGESGTGKEVLARFIHSVSARSRGPFIGVNCAALPEQLLESELFGHERGAFTGATHTKPGQIELAAGGVLFLDEVTEMSMQAQAKFLRFLQEREFRRVGGTRLLKSDVQVIAATNADLQRSIHSGQFRRDLYYRLRVVDIRLPALRDRRDDIPPLTEALLDDISARLGITRPRLTPAALQALFHHRWPGNVRELRNVLERAAILTDDRTIDVRDLSFDDDETWDDTGSSTHLGTIERGLIEKVLRECGGNKSLAAKRLGLSRMQLYVRLRRYDLPSGETAH
jgi:transcriptional regulator with PAS, ATPase and Fis domain